MLQIVLFKLAKKNRRKIVNLQQNEFGLIFFNVKEFN